LLVKLKVFSSFSREHHSSCPRKFNGGLLHVNEVLKHIGSQKNIDESDIVRSVESLEKSFGPGVTIKSISKSTKNSDTGSNNFKGGRSNEKLISSVPNELDLDQNLALGLAGANGGSLTFLALIKEFGWTPERCSRVCTFFVREGLCWVCDESSRINGSADADRKSSKTSGGSVDEHEKNEKSYWFPSIALVSIQAGEGTVYNPPPRQA
jgi:hypothetical protein